MLKQITYNLGKMSEGEGVEAAANEIEKRNRKDFL